MVPYSRDGSYPDRCDHAPGTAEAVVPEKAGIYPGSHRLAEWSTAGRVDLSPPSRSTCIAIGASWLPGLAPAGVGRNIPGHSVRSERRRVDQLARKVRK